MSALTGLPYLASLFLAGLFVLAAVAKWRDLPATARSLRALGLPRPWTAARALPAVELALALGLVVTPAGSAAVALSLLSAFSVFLVSRLRAGVDAPCQCFGTWGSGRPLSWVDVVRNVWLMAAAVLALSGGWPTAPTPAAVGLGLILVAVAVASLRFLRHRNTRRESSAPERSDPPVG